MKKPWIVFLAVIIIGIFLVSFYTREDPVLSDEPLRIPTKAEIVAPGLSTYDITRTNDEGLIPLIMQPTGIVTIVTNRLLLTSCEKGTELCKLQAIHDFIRTNYEYKPTTPEHTYIQPPGETLLQGTGDELELALLTASMQRAAGFKNEIIKSRFHTFVRTYVGNTSFMTEPSCQGCKFMSTRVTLEGTEEIFN